MAILAFVCRLAKAHTALICNAEWKQNLKWEASTPDSFVTKKCPESHAPGYYMTSFNFRSFIYFIKPSMIQAQLPER